MISIPSVAVGAFNTREWLIILVQILAGIGLLMLSARPLPKWPLRVSESMYHWPWRRWYENALWFVAVTTFSLSVCGILAEFLDLNQLHVEDWLGKTPSQPSEWLTMVVYASLVPPLYEEIIFRGWIQGAATERYGMVLATYYMERGTLLSFTNFGG